MASPKQRWRRELNHERGLDGSYIEALAIDPVNPATLYAGSSVRTTGYGVLKSTNAAMSWTPDRQRRAILRDRSSATRHITPDSVAWRKHRRRRDLGSRSSGLDDTFVVALAIDPSDPLPLRGQ
jgi:hypothetical protein